jgi:hypothetical protein
MFEDTPPQDLSEEPDGSPLPAVAVQFGFSKIYGQFIGRPGAL